MSGGTEHYLQRVGRVQTGTGYKCETHHACRYVLKAIILHLIKYSNVLKNHKTFI